MHAFATGNDGIGGISCGLAITHFIFAYHPRHWLAVAGNDDFLAFLDAIQQGAQGVLGFKRPDILHESLQKNLA